MRAIAELNFIKNDSNEVAVAMREISCVESELKYLDQFSDACTVLYRRHKM